LDSLESDWLESDSLELEAELELDCSLDDELTDEQLLDELSELEELEELDEILELLDEDGLDELLLERVLY
jgi:hypothetical protein